MASVCDQNFDELVLGADISVTSAETKHVLFGNYLPLKMILDDRTKDYVRYSKTLVIFQGQYSRYRSETIRQLPEIFDSRVRIISDSAFLRDSRSYSCNRRREFSEYIQRECRRAYERGKNLIVLDTTVLDVMSVRQCLAIAHALKYTVLVVPPIILPTEGTYWPSGSMATILSDTLCFPVRNFFQQLFCGYFFHESDSADLRECCTVALREMILGVPEFSHHRDPESFFAHYQLDARREDPAYCVFKVFAGENDVVDYFKLEAVKKNYGKVAKLNIYGFIVTPYVIVARVRLTKEQKELWAMNEDLHSHSATPFYPSVLTKQSKAYLPGANIRAIRPPIRGTFKDPGPIDSTPANNIAFYNEGKGCHILLGNTTHAPVRHIDFDGNFGAYAEALTLMVESDIEFKDLNSCFVRQIDKYFYIYLKTEMSVDGMFTSCCKPNP